MKLTDRRNAKIERRFADVRPRSFYAKVKALMTCDEFSPRLTDTQARSLLAQRRRPKANPYAHDEAAFQRMRSSRADLYN